MAVYYERRNSNAARWSRWVAVFSAVLLVTSTVGHRWQLIETVPFFWLLAVVGCLATLSLCLSASGFSRLWNHGDRGGKDATRATLVALLVLTPFLVSGYRVMAYPQLHDISTDVADPPAMPLAAAERRGAMNLLEPITADSAAVQQLAYPEITGRRYDVPVDRVMESIETLLAARNWVRRGTTPGAMGDDGQALETTLELRAWTFWMALPVDVAIRITDEGDTTYVDMRSASRYMLHDMGDNAHRIAAFLEELGTDVAGKVAVAPDAGD